MIRIRVGIGQHEHSSEDGGTTWSHRLREVPPRHTPVVHGDVDLTRLPPSSKETCWDFVTLLPCGFGVAVDHQRMDGTKAHAGVFVTIDGAEHWHKRDTKPRLPILRTSSWKVERFESLAVQTPGVVALAWEDPWIFEGSQSHIICTRDQGESWEYHCLGYANPYLAVDYGGRLLALNDGYYIESRDGGSTWSKSNFNVDWPEGYNKKRVALLRHVSFTEADLGYALIVHWPSGSPRDSLPDVGLLISTDNGMRWNHLQVFEGPNIGDINERHVLDLRVT